MCANLPVIISRAQYADSVTMCARNDIISKQPDIVSSPIYWLLYYIFDNFSANVRYLMTSNVQLAGLMGFLPIQRNVRNSIESYLNILLLINDPEFISVIEKERPGFKTFWPHKYHQFHMMNNKNPKKHFELWEKIRFYNETEYISVKEGIRIDMSHPWPIITEPNGTIELKEVIELMNSAIHPNVHNTQYTNYSDVIMLLKMLLCLDAHIFFCAHNIFFGQYKLDQKFYGAFYDSFMSSVIDYSCGMPNGYINCLATINVDTVNTYSQINI